MTFELNFSKPASPLRIVSLVPSQTELLFHLGLEEEVVGITKFCVHPSEWFRSKKRIGGTKNIHLQAIIDLNPTLILANKEENVKEQVEALQKVAPVYVSDIANLEDALKMISDIGQLTGTNEKATEIVQGICHEFSSLKKHLTIQRNKPSDLKAAYLIWRNPYMAAGGDTFIDDMLQRCGLENIFQKLNRYPEVSVDEIANSGCEVLLLSSEPYPFKQKHIEELQKKLPYTTILLADGEMFSWYGSRLLQAPKYFVSLLQNIQANH